MNLYLVTQTENNDYDTYDSFVCAASSEEEARLFYPDGSPSMVVKDGKWVEEETGRPNTFAVWATSLERVTVERIGVADDGKKGVILASFNAG